MRELKFRAWNGREYIYSFTDDGKDRLGWFFSNTHGMNKEQYIGIKDENNHYIYEGDITSSGEVVWICDENLSEFIGWHIKDHWRPESRYVSVLGYSHLKVIGNIHQNPELVTK